MPIRQFHSDPRLEAKAQAAVRDGKPVPRFANLHHGDRSVDLDNRGEGARGARLRAAGQDHPVHPPKVVHDRPKGTPKPKGTAPKAGPERAARSKASPPPGTEVDGGVVPTWSSRGRVMQAHGHDEAEFRAVATEAGQHFGGTPNLDVVVAPAPKPGKPKRTKAKRKTKS